MKYDTLTPLYPSTAYKTSKDLGAMRSVAVYAVATLSRALGVIEGAELHCKASKRLLWAEEGAANSAQSGAQALLNVATIYANRAGGPTDLTGLVEDAADRIWELSKASGNSWDPAPTFEELTDELSQAAGLVLALLIVYLS